MKRNIELEHEDHAILRLFGSGCLNDTVKRLGIVAAYSVDPDFKRRACALRDKLADWPADKWESFFREELRNMTITVNVGESRRPDVKNEMICLKFKNMRTKYRTARLRHGIKKCRCFHRSHVKASLTKRG